MENIERIFIINEGGLEKILEYIHQHRGIDLLSAYRREFVFRRLRLRLRNTKVEKYQEYLELLEKDPEEYYNFLDLLSVNVTEFFRDAEVFEEFRKNILPQVIKKKEANNEQLIRIWSAGCAHGQEPYSLAILLKEALPTDKKFFARIWATDIDDGALKIANKAEYTQNDFKGVDKRILEKYFNPVYNDRYVLNTDVKQAVLFKKQNMTEEAPLRYMDVVFCRNVMIYFHRQQQELLFKKFYQALNSGGYLIIGKTESIWSRELFSVVNPLLKIYKKNDPILNNV